jgi:hypothetical protein
VLPTGRAHEPEGEEGAALGAARLAVAAAEAPEAPRIDSRVERLRTSFVICGPPGEARALVERLSRVTAPVGGEVPLSGPGVEEAIERAFDPLYAALFPDHPIGRPVRADGPPSPSRAAAEAFRRSRYTPLGALLVITGEVGDPFAMAVESARPFASWPVRAAAGLPPLPPASEAPVPSGSAISSGLAEEGRRALVVGGRLLDRGSPERVAAALLLVAMAQHRLTSEVPFEDLLSGYPLGEGGVWALGLRGSAEEAGTRLALVGRVLDELAAGAIDADELEEARGELLDGRLARTGSALPDAKLVLRRLLESVEIGDAESLGMIELTAALRSLAATELAEEAAVLFRAENRVTLEGATGTN